MDNPLPVTVCLPCRNRRWELEVALPRILAQNPAEIIVVDDGSTDGSAEWLEDQPVRIFRLEDRGYRQNPGDVSNIAAREATEPVLIHQSAEVAPLGDCYERLLDRLTPLRPVFARVLDAPMSHVEGLKPGAYPPAELLGEEWHDSKPFDIENQIGAPFVVYTGFERQRPLFFCGAIFGHQWESLGGYDERTDVQGDLAFARTMRAAGVECLGLGDAVALHIQHGRV